MSNMSQKSAGGPRAGMPAFGTFSNQQAPASILFEKSNPGLRRSTPDSEALASSDDEADTNRPNVNNSKPVRSARRTSWLNDVSATNVHRKPSMTASYSPSTSNPGTPSADQLPWSNTSNPTSTAWNPSTTSYPWGTIWTQDGRKELPSRLQELHSSNGDGGIPFTIPLQPTPKTYRSQSYSVGQLDTTTTGPSTNITSTSTDAARNRVGGQFPSLQRRTSRAGGLSATEGGLGRVREVEDDDEQTGSAGGQSDNLSNSQQSIIDKLERENAQLRHAAQGRSQGYGSPASSHAAGSNFRNSRIRGAVPEETDAAVEEYEEASGIGLLNRRDHSGRRLSEHTGLPFDRQQFASLGPHDGIKKAHWQTSLGFGGIPEAPQSRRHSFADVPTRHGSFSSNGGPDIRRAFMAQAGELDPREEDAISYGSAGHAGSRGEDRELALVVPKQASNVSQPSELEMEYEYLRNRRAAAVYFNTTESTRRAADARVQQSFVGANPYVQYQQAGTYLGPASQPLHIVNFKCCRSEVFYIQDGTGLRVQVGDLVIVEADRGTDLGTVQHTNITWDEAKRYKEHYAEEHYKWLMMFSQQSRNGGPNVINPNGLPAKQSSAVGGMGPQGHHGAHENPHSELKPKMIKRLAQNHEIQALKDKEGNEAKAKRVCQQKVVEHRLNMEILDAEFQMDSKKLTFYYFADSYINFNSLVTDLFKIYKTRIWMSAINPASFQTPTSSLGLTPAYGHVMTPGRDSPSGRRRQFNPAQQSGIPQYTESYDNDRMYADQSGLRGAFMGQYQQFGSGMHQANPGMGAFGNNMQGNMDPFASYYGQPAYQMLNPAAPNFASSRPDMRSRGSNQSPTNDWTGRFQGLSLGS